MTKIRIILVLAAIGSGWVVLNSLFVIGWGIFDHWSLLPSVWLSLAFQVSIKLLLIHAAYVVAMALLYCLWATSPAGKARSPSEPWH